MQLIMQFCDLRSLLRLARCSSTILASACAPAAWRGLSPLLLRTDVTLNPPLIGERIAGSRLLRHCDIALRWKSSEHFIEEALHDVSRIPRLHSFLIPSGVDLSPWYWTQFLSTPSLPKHLRVLRTGDPSLQECDSALLLQQAPLLHTLQLALCREVAEAMPPDYEPPLLAALPLLPHLTDLRVMLFQDAGLLLSLSCARPLGQCGGPRSLHLHHTLQPFVCAVLSAGGLHCLEHLRLTVVAIRAIQPQGIAPGAYQEDSGHCSNWRSAMQALAATATLRTLTLHHVQGINALLEYAHLLFASLQLVRVDGSFIFSSSPRPLSEHSVPSVTVLGPLLAALPATQFVLNRPETKRPIGVDWLQLTDQWNELVKAHPRQLTVLDACVPWAGDEPTDDIAFCGVNLRFSP
jgi:hypothetical protein